MCIADNNWMLARITLTFATLPIVVACASSPGTVGLPSPDIEIRQPAPFSPAVSLPSGPISASFDLSYWEELTGLPDGAELNFWTCGTMLLELVISQGEWRLVGISEDNHYTPILDIYNDRTGNRVNNGTVYYHFKLFPAD